MTELWQFEIKSVTYGTDTYPVTFKSNSKSDKVDLANIFKENFKLNIYFISIGKQNLNSELCLEDIIYIVTLVISAENSSRNIFANDIENDDKDQKNFILKNIFMILQELGKNSKSKMIYVT